MWPVDDFQTPSWIERQAPRGRKLLSFVFVLEAGCQLVGLFGLEGPARMLADFEARWADPRQRADLLWAAETVEQEPSLLGLSSHLLAVARRPTNLNV